MSRKVDGTPRCGLVSVGTRCPAAKARLRVLLDEAANIAPLKDLPRLLAQGAGHGIRFATVWQSLGQMRETYGHGSDSLLANCTAKLFMGSLTDQATRGYVRDLLGDAPTADGERRKVTAASLQQLVGDRALLISGDHLPAMVALRPWWHRTSSRSSRRLSGSRDVGRVRGGR